MVTHERSTAESVLLSILVPTVPGRETKLARLLTVLEPQTERRPDVQLFVLRDTRQLTIGAKRNKMVALADGAYVAFVDDDDAVASDYVEAICRALREEQPDVACFQVRVLGHGRPRPCRYHPDLRHENLPGEYRRKPNHLMAWRREIVAAHPFQPIRRGEDTEWAERVATHARRVAVIDRELYTYQFDPRDNSRTPR